MASVGQVSAHAPQETQAESRKPSSRPAAMLAPKPRPVAVSANVPWTSSHARTQRPQRDAQLVLEAPGTGGARRARPRAAAPGQRGSPTSSIRATCGQLGVLGGRRRAARRARARRPRRRRGGRSRRACRPSCPRARRVVQEATGPGAPSMPTRQTRQAPNGAWRSSKQSVGIWCRGAASSIVVPGGTVQLPRRRSSSVITASPSSSGKCASRLRIGAGMPPPCAHRLPSSSVSSSSSSLARSTGSPFANISCARCRARSGTGSTCRSSRRRRSAAGAWPPRACRCARRRRRSRRGRPCSPPAASGSKSKTVSSWNAGQDAAERPADLQRLDRRAAGHAAGDVLAQLARSSSRTGPRRRRASRSAR